MAGETKGSILKKEIVYEGEEYKRESLQQMVTDYQSRHSQDVKDLDRLRQTHDDIAKEMRKDLVADKTAWDCVKDMMTFDVKKMGSNFHGLLEKIPIINDYVSDRPVADLLREKIHIAETRTKQVGQFLDQIEAQMEALRVDITRLNQKMVVAAQNEEKAAAYILELRDHQQRLESELKALGEDTTATKRQKQAELDEVKRIIWEHGSKLRLYSNAEDRISNIVTMNNNFLEILTNLHTNMTILFESSQEILDELRGHLTGLATATEASELTLSMRQSIDSLKISVNKVATLASETSLYLTQNVDKLMAQMRVYDDATKQLIESNLAAEREIHDQRVDETIQLAQKELTTLQESKSPPAA
ncbi:MAG TPA: hypothetical protein VGO93_26595 [Candidatus Xenobia bacterium]